MLVGFIQKSKADISYWYKKILMFDELNTKEPIKFLMS